jgi:light-regulated signal transduction histidine kinase (bacteriophytochrome)
LVQLVQHLISNGLKFRRPDRPMRVHMGVRPEEGHWLFWVKDNGIDASYKDRIFKIFQRLHARDQCPGTGIGLAIGKKIVDRHGGRIWVESRADQGATFYFTIR